MRVNNNHNKVETMKGNDKDCICHKPKDKHTKRCDAYRLSEMFKKCTSVLINGGSLTITRMRP